MSVQTNNLAHILEALIIASDEPLSLARLRDLTEASSGDLRAALGELEAFYHGRGISLQEVAGGWQFRSSPEHAGYVQQLWQSRPPKLSRSMLETLAIIAYRQPVTRAEIEMLRGLKVSSTIIGGLQERGWIKVLGRKEVPGRPHLYGTGKQFLIDFGLNALSDLPEITQLMDQEELESGLLTEATPDDQGELQYDDLSDDDQENDDEIIADADAPAKAWQTDDNSEEKNDDSCGEESRPQD
ncbi:MAG: SMC-Scp complex subunit ScpB [Zetaproteobacteria bacterium CG11_big_fil_rev_8_21_14_0_20_59_439]|nr:MAG: SMC-Scp complex subunit ScpB [Zetaproteobacteria bacterium CG11_big_fil_rev_8_21_14_0_20_59_439]